MKKPGHQAGHLTSDAPGGQPVMVAYWTTLLKCSYANAAFLNWFGKSLTQAGVLSLDELPGVSFPSLERLLTDVLNGATRDVELEWTPAIEKAVRKAVFRFVPDFLGDEVRGFMMTGIDISVAGAGNNAIHEADTGSDAKSADFEIREAIGRKLQRYADELGALLAGQWGAAANNPEHPISVGFKIDCDSEMVVRQAGAEIFTTEVNLYDCIAKAVSSIDDELKASGCSVRIRVSPFIYVHANPTYMESIICGFVGSALLNRARERTPVIELSSMVVGDETVLNIKDNGDVIDLESFYGRSIAGRPAVAGENGQPHSPLFMVRQQVYAMGGYVGVESEPAKGTWFRLYFKTKVAGA